MPTIQTFNGVDAGGPTETWVGSCGHCLQNFAPDPLHREPWCYECKRQVCLPCAELHTCDPYENKYRRAALWEKLAALDAHDPDAEAIEHRLADRMGRWQHIKAGLQEIRRGLLGH